MSKKLTAQQALEKISSVYLRFLRNPQKRKSILRQMESLTEIIVNDHKVLDIVKFRAKQNLEKYRGMV